ncbi:MAG: TrbI/VirB10 family protein [Rickettsiaceae bacterium]|nr:TrbI/VirB10 family protein [Rickettsiaceae bacterium]
MSQNISAQPSPKEMGKEVPKVGFELSKIASNPKQGKLLVILFVLISGYLGYRMLTSEKRKAEEETKIEKVERPKEIFNPSQDQTINQEIAVPVLPKTPELKEIKPIEEPPTPKKPTLPAVQNTKKPESVVAPPPPPIPTPQEKAPLPEVVTSSQETPPVSTPSDLPIMNNDNLPKHSKDALPRKSLSPEEQKKREKKQKSSIMLLSGIPKKTQQEIEQNLSFQKITDSSYVLRYGKVIDAVVESAFSTDFQSEVRAIIAKDVYSENGKTILIPKGSRAYGTPVSNANGTYARVDIKWTRVDLPSGYSLKLENAVGLDDLGRKGIQGRLDSKIKEKIGSTVMTSALNIAFAGALDKLTNTNQNASLTSDGAKVVEAVNNVYNDASITVVYDKMKSMCSAAKNAISNQSSDLYNQVTQTCNTALYSSVTPTSTDMETLHTDLVSEGNAAANASSNSSSSSSSSSTSTQTKAATLKAMTDFAKTMDEIAKQNTPQPTITLDQGAKIKIYITKDYQFPKDAVSSSRILQ